MRTRALWLFPAVGILLASSPVQAILAHHWSERFGDDSYQYSRPVATDGSGNVFLTGAITGVVDFGGGPLPFAFSDISLAKFDVNGNHLWSKRFGDFFNQDPQSLATDGSGNVVVSGRFGGTVDFGGGPLASTGGFHLFVAKFDANGNHLWSKSFGDEYFSADDGQWVATDGSGNVVVTALFDGTIDFGGGPLTSAGGSLDIAVAKFDADGNHIWSQRFGDDSYQFAQAIAADGSDNVVITGFFNGTLNFGGGDLTSAGSDMFVAQFDADGNHVWSKSFAGAIGYSVDTDGSGNVVTTGGFYSAADFGGEPLSDEGGGDIFVAKFDADGNHVWSESFGNTDWQQCQSVATDGSGNVVITCSSPGTLDFGGDPLPSVGYEDIFVAKFDADGNHLWSERFGDDDWSELSSLVAADASGNVVVTGYFFGTLDFGGGPLTCTGGSDIFLVRFMEEEPIPVLITRFEAAPAGAGIEVRWEVRSDEDIESFALYRGEDTRPAPITVASGPFQSNMRSFWDAKVEAGRTYTYELVLRTSAGSEFRSPVATAMVRALQATLEQNHPNPFNPSTTIAYTIDEQTQVGVGIYDAAGALVVRLDQGVQTAGRHEVTWNGVDSSGNAVGSGVYFYRLETRSGAGTRKMVLLK